MLLRTVEEACRHGGAQMAPFEASLKFAKRFVFTEWASLAVNQLGLDGVRLKDATALLFPPFPVTWLEVQAPGQRLGFLWLSDKGENQRGVVHSVDWRESHPQRLETLRLRADFFTDRWWPLHITLPSDDPMLQRFRAGGEYAKKLAEEVEHDEARLACCIMAMFALIASKGVTRATEPDLTKLNAARAKAGKHALFSYVEIKLTLDAERAVRAAQRTGTGNAPLHPVRAHLRLLPTGKVVIVKAHMRGNPAHGIRDHRYTVRTSADG